MRQLGVKAIESLPPTLDEKTKELRSGFVRAFAGINTFELGFEQNVLRLDLASGRYSIVPAGIPAGYSAQYNTTCKRVIQVPPEAQIYIGRFKVSVRTPNNQTQVVETIDTLGIYRPEEFNSVRDAEVEARRGIMSSELRKRGLNVVGIELVSVGRISAPDTRGWEFASAPDVDLSLPIKLVRETDQDSSPKTYGQGERSTEGSSTPKLLPFHSAHNLPSHIDYNGEYSEA